ncbi:TlpA disulfide reductase family protein [Albimonas pacifica]|uniref:Thiol-disulfide isomerase or thioredoxin n=1 Tax=Albimonas pacifica TaxID=1114924 RepID=A0A1I3IRV0_9RHOB|nr:TlpA disulfide reductase family protein [Albimonas pacifica]SFI50570.1 Thiol-disulfide isomerase or thioredoxin [Albimonas pacifica]
MRLAGLVALVIGAAAIFANPAAAGEGLTPAQRQEIAGLSTGAMAKFALRESLGDPLEAEFVNANGAPATVADFAGKVTVLNLWATWCPPCLKEMPALNELQAALKGSGAQVVTVAVQSGGRAKAKDFLKEKMLYELPAYADERNALPREVGILGLPTTLILDPQGREIGRLQGDAEWNAPEAEALLRRLAEMTAAGG